jgi:chemotaxis protein CheX
MMADHCIDTRWIEQLDGVVVDVFNIMLRQSCEVVEDAAAAAEIDIAAEILLSGAIDAQCLVELPQATAKKLTDAFLGSEDDWEDALIEDAIGELCNMIAGGWKGALGATASTSGLSVPAISRACAPDRNPPNGCSLRMRRTYAFRNSPFTVSLAIREPRDIQEISAQVHALKGTGFSPSVRATKSMGL